MKDKKLLIIGGVVVAVVIILLTRSKTAAANETSMTFETSDEQMTYEQLKALIPTKDQSWVIPLAKARGGDKAIALGEILSEVAPNPKGKYTYNYGGLGVTKMLWDEHTMEQVYIITQNYKMKKAGW